MVAESAGVVPYKYTVIRANCSFVHFFSVGSPPTTLFCFSFHCFCLCSSIPAAFVIRLALLHIDYIEPTEQSQIESVELCIWFFVVVAKFMNPTANKRACTKL